MTLPIFINKINTRDKIATKNKLSNGYILFIVLTKDKRSPSYLHHYQYADGYYIHSSPKKTKRLFLTFLFLLFNEAMVVLFLILMFVTELFSQLIILI